MASLEIACSASETVKMLELKIRALTQENKKLKEELEKKDGEFQVYRKQHEISFGPPDTVYLYPDSEDEEDSVNSLPRQI